MTPRKLSFYLAFHGSHVALFIIGWYVANVLSTGMQADVHQVETTDQQGTGASQSANVLGVDIKRRGAGSQRRCHFDHATHVQKHSTSFPTENQMAASRRIAMVSQTGCLLAALLDNSTYYRPLCQLLQYRANATSQTSSCSSPLYPSWWSDRPYHAFMHASDLHHSASEDSSTVL